MLGKKHITEQEDWLKAWDNCTNIYSKDYIDSLMQANGKDKLEVGDKKLSYKKSKATNIFDEGKLKDWINSSNENKAKYFKYKEPEFAKKELGDALKQGETIPGVELVENKNLSIK